MKPLRIIAKLLIILLVFSLVSCDENIFTDYADDSSDEAQLEAALIYLDDGEYSKAKEILLTLDQNDEEVIRALGSAYAGIAGLDVPSIITAIDDNTNNSVEAFGKILGDTDANNQLTGSEIDTKLNEIYDAITQYEKLTLSDSVKAQLCVLYATRIILEIADGISSNGAADSNDVPLDSTIVGLGGGKTYDITTINSDLNNIQNYISSIDPDLQDGFDTLMNDINAYDLTSNGLDSTELGNYINGLTF